LKVLLVEDQQLKAADALTCIRQVASEVRHVTSYVDAKRMMKERWADVIVLDMTLPVHVEQAAATAPYVYGGEELLKWACPRMRVPPTIVFTQFDSFSDRGTTDSLDTLYARLVRDYPTVVCGRVRYGVDLSWEGELLLLIDELKRR
jgi:CheY-like chemotaxis protein